MQLRVLFVALAVISIPSAFAFAQTIPGIENTLFIQAPAVLAPNATVELSLQDSFVSLSDSEITWYVNGKQTASGEGETTLSVTLGALGKTTRVSAIADTSEGTLSTETTLNPATIDLLWQSDSYVPPFYKGRALPSAGSTLTLSALPHIMVGRKQLAASKLNYTWKINGAVQKAASGIGKASLQVPVPTFSNVIDVEVSAASSDGSEHVTAEETIPVVTPVLVLYEDHPLFGIRFSNAFGENTNTGENEVSLIALPYFAPNGGTDLSYMWKVNDVAKQADEGSGNELTIDAQHASAAASVDLEAAGSNASFLDLTGQWTVTFNSFGGFGTTSSGPSDNIFLNNQ